MVKECLPILCSSHRQAFETLKPLTVDIDLEKYYDIYEISQSDIQEGGEPVAHEVQDEEDIDNLRNLKLRLQSLHLIRKLYLCSLLALHADGGKSDFMVWTTASDSMQSLTVETREITSRIDTILHEEEGRPPRKNSPQRRNLANHAPAFSTPPTPRLPLTPGKERMRGQMRKLTSLSQGIRGLQAKMHLLRDDSERALDQSIDSFATGFNILEQYDSIGSDLKNLMQEWQDGRSALVTSLDKNEHRRSQSQSRLLAPASPTLSLGGLTAVEGGSPDALIALNEYPRSPRSRSSTANSSSGEEVFEAVGLPRQRSLLTREERLAKMKEDRVRQALAKGKAEANGHMLKELETVIRLRPRGRTTGRMTSI